MSEVAAMEQRNRSARSMLRTLRGLAVLLASVAALLTSAPARSAGMAVDIRVAPEGWGRADGMEVASLLQAVADVLIVSPEQVPARTIVVSPGEGNPVTLYAKGENDEYQVRLSARDRRWSQYAYQFGHELCHIMAAFDTGAANPHQWFEETLCETAALYTLRTLATTWKTAPPYPGWEAYAPAFNAYADQLLGEPHRQLPAHTSAAAWLQENEAGLRNHPYRREKNEILANQLLPLFESQPQGWQALAVLNRDEANGQADGDFSRHLQHWYGNANVPQQAFIHRILTLLGVTTPPAMAQANAGATL